jgi:hypothetical protein
MRKSKNLPSSALVIRTYAHLEQFARAFADERLNLLILIGAPGLGKSRVLRAALNGLACFIDGHTTAFGLYLKLYESRNQTVVIDDVDSLHKDRSAIRLLKSLCQTEIEKTLSWNSDARTLDRRQVPHEFSTTSRVAIVANEWRSLNLDVAALEDRGHVLCFDPPSLEVHVQAAKWFWDQAAYDLLGDHLHVIEQPSFRHYVAAAELKHAGLDWKSAVLARCLEGKQLLVAQLKADRSYAFEEDRVRAFVAAGGGSRATYFNIAKRLKPAGEVPKIRLANSHPPEPPSKCLDVLEILRKRFRGLGSG